MAKHSPDTKYAGYEKMMLCGYWPEDGRGSLLVVSFDNREDVVSFKRSIELIAGQGHRVLLLDAEGCQMQNRIEISIEKGLKTAASKRSNRFSVWLDAASIAELLAKLEGLGCDAMIGHNYVALNSDLDLLISIGEYTKEQFD